MVPTVLVVIGFGEGAPRGAVVPDRVSRRIRAETILQMQDGASHATGSLKKSPAGQGRRQWSSDANPQLRQRLQRQLHPRLQPTAFTIEQPQLAAVFADNGPCCR